MVLKWFLLSFLCIPAPVEHTRILDTVLISGLFTAQNTLRYRSSHSSSLLIFKYLTFFYLNEKQFKIVLSINSMPFRKLLQPCLDGDG